MVKPQQGGSYNEVYNSGSFVAVAVYRLAERNMPKANRKVNGVFPHAQRNVTGVDQMDRFGLVQFFFNEKVEKYLRMCRKTFWYYAIDRFSFSRHNQYLVAETLSMKCFATDQNRLDIVKSIFSFFNLLIVSLPPRQIFPTSGGKVGHHDKLPNHIREKVTAKFRLFF